MGEVFYVEVLCVFDVWYEKVVWCGGGDVEVYVVVYGDFGVCFGVDLGCVYYWGVVYGLDYGFCYDE